MKPNPNPPTDADRRVHAEIDALVTENLERFSASSLAFIQEALQAGEEEVVFVEICGAADASGLPWPMPAAERLEWLAKALEIEEEYWKPLLDRWQRCG